MQSIAQMPALESQLYFDVFQAFLASYGEEANNKARSMALLEVIKLAKALEIKRFWIEDDYQLLIQILLKKASFKSWELQLTIRK